MIDAIRRMWNRVRPRAGLDAIVSSQSMLWGSAVDGLYHGPAQAAMDEHWTDIIAPFLAGEPIDMSRCLDFATGYGRNAAKLREAGASRVTLVDVHPDNVAHCRQRFAGDKAIVVHQNNGFDLSGLSDGAFTFVYSFDAMVHFDERLVAAYLPEFFRVLEPGGYAFVHHSNYSAAPGTPFMENPHWRNHMSVERFADLARSAGFTIARQQKLSWIVDDLDGLSLLQRPLQTSRSTTPPMIAP
jgi:SAM-dependent methyltransferase